MIRPPILVLRDGSKDPLVACPDKKMSEGFLDTYIATLGVRGRPSTALQHVLSASSLYPETIQQLWDHAVDVIPEASPQHDHGVT